MKFLHPTDTKSFILGVLASITTVIVWDIVKYRKQLVEFEEKELNIKD